MKKYIVMIVFACVLNLVVSSVTQAAITPDPTPLPTTAEECKNGGWQWYFDVFKNQGDCVSYVSTDGRNEPSGGSI